VSEGERERERESVDSTLINKKKKKKKKKNRYACKEKTVRERKRFLWFAQREGERSINFGLFLTLGETSFCFLSLFSFFLSFFLHSHSLYYQVVCPPSGMGLY